MQCWVMEVSFMQDCGKAGTPQLGTGSSQGRKGSWKLGWGREEKMASRPGCPRAMGAASRTGGHKQGGGTMEKKANDKIEMDASCTSPRGPSTAGCPHMGLALGPWLPAVPAKGAGPGVRARRGFPQAFATLLPQKCAVLSLEPAS